MLYRCFGASYPWLLTLSVDPTKPWKTKSQIDQLNGIDTTKLCTMNAGLPFTSNSGHIVMMSFMDLWLFGLGSLLIDVKGNLYLPSENICAVYLRDSKQPEIHHSDSIRR